jgi:glyoxylase-like metal-dependent hydrolase (beta-lactamase superfamily II)
MFKHTEYESVHYWEVARSYLSGEIYTTGFFLIDGMLVDCGPTNALPMLKSLFADIRPEKVLITHHHEDHTGNAAYFQEHHVILLAHSEAGPALEHVSRTIPFYRNLVWGRPRPAAFETMPAVVTGNTCSLEVIETPGHSHDHVCLYERERGWLFTGDLYLASYLRYLRDDEDIYEIMRSLRKLIELHPKILFCNHRGPVEKGEEALSKKLAFLERLRDQVQQAQEQGIALNTLASQLFKQDRFMRWLSAGQFCTMNLLRALAHPDTGAKLEVDSEREQKHGNTELTE